MAAPLNLLGQRFGTLTVEELVGSEIRNGKKFGRIWKCVCDCGNINHVTSNSLRQGNTTRCSHSCALRVHGMVGTPTYNSWVKMLSRTRYDEYKEWYGDVSCCDRWEPRKGGSFENFYADMGTRPEGMTLNRINSSEVYSKETCEWADLTLQSFDQKKSKSNTSGRTGVCFEGDKWTVKIGVKGESIRLYRGDSYEEACRIREEAELKYYGFTRE